MILQKSNEELIYFLHVASKTNIISINLLLYLTTKNWSFFKKKIEQK